MVQPGFGLGFLVNTLMNYVTVNLKYSNTLWFCVKTALPKDQARPAAETGITGITRGVFHVLNTWNPIVSGKSQKIWKLIPKNSKICSPLPCEKWGFLVSPEPKRNRPLGGGWFRQCRHDKCTRCESDHGTNFIAERRRTKRTTDTCCLNMVKPIHSSSPCNKSVEQYHGQFPFSQTLSSTPSLCIFWIIFHQARIGSRYWGLKGTSLEPMLNKKNCNPFWCAFPNWNTKKKWHF